MDLSPEGFAVMWFLQKSGIKQAEKIANKIAPAFEKYPHWQVSSHQEQEVRKLLYKALIDAKVNGVVDIAKNLMRMLRRAGK